MIRHLALQHTTTCASMKGKRKTMVAAPAAEFLAPSTFCLYNDLLFKVTVWKFGQNRVCQVSLSQW
jgi:hypothetical protein